ncbi:MAG: tetratricopeptide repeat protein [Candidatus Gastranaerophilales bacterium]|nr:tetratricopeptide repeat protein [Candidatus Gastranaerophilales bacterium]
MKKLNFLKPEINGNNIDSIINEIGTIESFDSCILENRLDYINEIIGFLQNSDENIFLLEGFQGSGKTSLIKFSQTLLDEGVASFYYNCSIVTGLDDLIFSLYTNFIKYSNREIIKNAQYSLDEKLINILRTVKIPVLIILDSFENLATNGQINDEIKIFIEYLLSLSNIKLIVSGKKIVTNFAGIKIRLGGLNDESIKEILAKSQINTSNQVLQDIMKATRGYPENLRLFIDAIRYLGASPFDILQEFSRTRVTFEEFMYFKLAKTTSSECQKILNILAMVRHSLNINSLKILTPGLNFSEIIGKLAQYNLISVDKEQFTIKEFFKKSILDKIVPAEKIKIHKLLEEFYSKQIPLPPKERLVKISRNTMHSEKFYHFRAHTKIINEFNNIGKKQIDDGFLAASFIRKSEDINYLPTNVLLGFENLPKTPKEPVDSNIETKISTNDISTPSQEIKIISSENIYENFNVELSEEEKQLISSSEDENHPETTAAEDISQEEIIHTDEIKSIFGKANVTKDPQGKLKLYERASNLALNQENYSLTAGIYIDMAKICADDFKYEEEINWLNKAMEIYSNTKDFENILKTQIKFATNNKNSYKHDLALKNYFFLLEKIGENSDNLNLIEIYTGIGDIYAYRKDLEKSLHFYNKALDISSFNNSYEETANTTFKMALTYDDNSITDEAVEYYKKCIGYYGKIPPNNTLASAYSNLASIYRENSEYELSIEKYLKSFEVDKNLNNFEGMYNTTANLAVINKIIGNYDRTLEFLRNGIQFAKNSQNSYYVASAYLEIGDFYKEFNIYEKALKSYILAKKAIKNSVSTDSREKVDRRLRQVYGILGVEKYNKVLNSIKK